MPAHGPNWLPWQRPSAPMDTHATHDSYGPSEPTTQTASLSVQPSLHRRPYRVSLYSTMGRPFSPKNLPLPNNNNNNQRQCLWCCHRDHSHCESSPGSFDECRLSAACPPTLRPRQPTWAVSPPINGCYHPHPPSPFVIITQPESRCSFYRPTEGAWKAEST